MSEFTAPRTIGYDPLSSDRTDILRISYFARTPQYGYLPNNGWGTGGTDAERIAFINSYNTIDRSQSAGDSPFYGFDDPGKINDLLKDNPENPARKTYFSLLNTSVDLGRTGSFAAAMVSPLGGFPKERFKRFFSIIPSNTIRPEAVCPILPDSAPDTRCLYVAVVPDFYADKNIPIQQEQTRALLGAMVTYHILQNFSPATTIQSSYLHKREGAAYKGELMYAMGMKSPQVSRNNKHTVAQNQVGEPGARGTIMDSLILYLQKSHTVVDIMDLTN